MSNTREYVIFKLAGEYYGLPIKNVENIEKLTAITRVPYTKNYIEGIINLRGNIIPIIDLRKRFSLPQIENSDDTRIIIIAEDEYNLGLIVDSSSETLQLNDSEIDSSPQINGSIEEKFVKEIGKHNGRIIMLLDIKKVLGIVEEEQV